VPLAGSFSGGLKLKFCCFLFLVCHASGDFFRYHRLARSPRSLVVVEGFQRHRKKPLWVSHTIKYPTFFVTVLQSTVSRVGNNFSAAKPARLEENTTLVSFP
jgi:hypothetical protein